MAPRDPVDDLARSLATPMPRRRALRLLGASLLTTALPFLRSAPASSSRPFRDCSNNANCQPGTTACGCDHLAGCYRDCCFPDDTCCLFPGRAGGPPCEKACCPPGTKCGPGPNGENCVPICEGQQCGQKCCKAGETCVDASRSLCCKSGENACIQFSAPGGPGTPGTPARCCGGTTPKCCANDKRIACCRAADGCCAGRCCPPDKQCVAGVCNCPRGRTTCGRECCAPNEKCCNGRCCPKTTTCCGEKCCAKGTTCCGRADCCGKNEKCCGDHCCGAKQTCCGDRCCKKGQKCCGDHCCDDDDKCCGDTCCKPGESCCGETCCTSTQVCQTVTGAGRAGAGGRALVIARRCCPRARAFGRSGCCPAGTVATVSGTVTRCCPPGSPDCCGEDAGGLACLPPTICIAGTCRHQ